jgi:hypothetical protein
MAKAGGGDGGKLLLAIGGVLLLAWLLDGRGKQNSPLVPDALENQLDQVVEALNRKFGHRWVTLGLDTLQTYLQRTLPGPAGLLNTVLWVEQNYAHLAGGAKKQFAVNSLGR